MKDEAFGLADYLRISVFAFALAGMAGGLSTIVLPVLLLDFAPEASKNTYLGMLTFAGLAVAILVQPAAGALSDFSRSEWGRRRPYILAGSLLAAACLFAIGLSPGYEIIFPAYLLLQLALNTAQGPYQAVIPDLVPGTKWGRASGVKNIAEVLGTIVCIRVLGYFMGNYGRDEQGWLWLALGFLASVLLAAMVVTVFGIRDGRWRDRSTHPQKLPSWATLKVDWKGIPEFRWFLLSRFLVFMVIGSVSTFGLYFMRDYLKMPDPASAIGDLMLTVGACTLLLAYPAGRLSDRVGRKPLLIFSGLLGGLGLWLLLLVHSYGGLVGCGLLIGVALAIFFSVNWALATDIVPKAQSAYYLGLTNLATAGGSGLSRLAGPGIDFLNTRQAGSGYSALIVACAFYFLLSTVALVKIREPRRPSGDADLIHSAGRRWD